MTIATVNMGKKTATRGEPTRASFTAEQLVIAANDLAEQASRLRFAATTMEQEPRIREIEVRYERNRVDGFKFLKSWVAQAVDSAIDARMDAAGKSKQN
jgi:hypothetical protein